MFFFFFPLFFLSILGLYRHLWPGENDNVSDSLNQMDEVMMYFLHVGYLQMHHKSCEWNWRGCHQNSKNTKPKFMYIYRFIGNGTGHLRKLLKHPGNINSHWMTVGIWKLVWSECRNGFTGENTAGITAVNKQFTFWAFKSHLSSIVILPITTDF